MGSLFWWQTKGKVKSPTAPEGQKPVIISQGWSLDPGPLQQERQSVEFSSQRQVITAESLSLLHCHSKSGLMEEWGWAVFLHLISGNRKYFLFHSSLPTVQALCFTFFFLHYFHLFPPLQLQTSLSSLQPRNGVIGSGGRVKKEALLAFTSPSNTPPWPSNNLRPLRSLIDCDLHSYCNVMQHKDMALFLNSNGL